MHSLLHHFYWTRCRCLFSFILLMLVGFISSRTTPIRAYSVFSRDQVDLHKYAAIIAASEQHRVHRNKLIGKLMNPVAFWLSKMNSGEFNNPGSKLRQENPKIDDLCEKYESKVLDLVYSYGLDPESFNSLSSEIAVVASLKKQVMEQARHYQVAAVLDPDLVSTVKAFEAKPQPKTIALGRSKKAKTNTDNRRDIELLKNFAAALKDVEAERLEARRGLLVLFRSYYHNNIQSCLVIFFLISPTRTNWEFKSCRKICAAHRCCQLWLLL